MSDFTTAEPTRPVAPETTTGGTVACRDRPTSKRTFMVRPPTDDELVLSRIRFKSSSRVISTPATYAPD